MDFPLLALVAVLGVAMLVAIVARRFHLPYTVGLVVVGALVALTRIAPPITLTHDLIFYALLPPLLFEASLMLPWSRLRDDLPPIAVLSIIGTAVSAAATTAGMIALLHWPFPSALMFGVLIAATDPVAVIALFKDLGVHGRLRLLVESESLFNDAIAAVLFALALAVAMPSGTSVPGFTEAALRAATIVFGGALVGLTVGAVAALIAGRTSDPLIETALTVVTAYGSFISAETLHFSGVLATVSAGLLIGNIGVLRDEGFGPLSSEGRAAVVNFWELAAFMANSLVFPLIGISVGSMRLSTADFVLLPVAVTVVLASRALTVYPLSQLFRLSRWRVAAREQHVLFWGGLRGALALALALTLPLEMPYRDAIVAAAFGVAAFSIVVQGLTMPALLRALGVKHGPPDT